jgi:CO/xanthine dehydrogenase Mo-binding subunit
VPSPTNPLGLRGAGEGGINGVGATLANAVEDALQQSGIIRRLPITPQHLMAQMKSSPSKTPHRPGER